MATLAEPRPIAPIDPAELRTAPRLNDPPLYVDNFWALVHDVSEGGASLMVNRTYEAGELINLVLSDAADGTELRVSAEVVWCGDVWNNVRRAGLKWWKLEPEQRLWLRHRLNKWLPCEPEAGA